MNPRHTSKDRTPAGRAVPALLVAGLLLLAGWLLVSLGQLDTPLHRAGSAEGPTWIAIPLGQRTGATSRFLVGRLERHRKAALPVDRIWTGATRPLLRLVTCGGRFDRATGHYRDNLIVYASPTGS